MCCVDNVGRYALLEPRYVFVQTAVLCSTAVFLKRQPPPTAALSARQSGQCLGLDPANTLLQSINISQAWDSFNTSPSSPYLYLPASHSYLINSSGSYDNSILVFFLGAYYFLCLSVSITRRGSVTRCAHCLLATHHGPPWARLVLAITSRQA